MMKTFLTGMLCLTMALPIAFGASDQDPAQSQQVETQADSAKTCCCKSESTLQNTLPKSRRWKKLGKVTAVKRDEFGTLQGEITGQLYYKTIGDKTHYRVGSYAVSAGLNERICVGGKYRTFNASISDGYFFNL